MFLWFVQVRFGKLATTLEELAKYLEAMEDTQVKSAMYYQHLF